MSTRQGVCYGIQEVLQSVTRQQLSELLPLVLPMIQTALCDDAESVRTVSQECAAHGGAFCLYLLTLYALALNIARTTVSYFGYGHRRLAVRLVSCSRAAAGRWTRSSPACSPPCPGTTPSRYGGG